MVTKTKEYIKDISSGLFFTLITCPLGLSIGVLTFANLNPEYINYSALTGLLAISVVSIFNFFLPYTYRVASAPDSVFAIFCNQLLVGLIALYPNAKDLPFSYLSFFLMLVMLSSMVFQFIFAKLNVHVLIRYISYPVSVALISSLGLMIAKVSLELIIDGPLVASITNWQALNPCYVLIGLSCFLIGWNNWNFGLPIPSLFLSLTLGSIAYFLCSLKGWVSYVFQKFELFVFIPFHQMEESIDLLFQSNGFIKLEMILVGGFVLAVLSVLYNMIKFVGINQVIKEKIPLKKYLFFDTVVNSTVGVLGGVLSPVAATETGILDQLKVKNKIIILVRGIAGLFILIVFPQICIFIPKCVLGGILLITGLKFFNPWVIKSTKEVVNIKQPINYKLILNLAIALAVIFTVLTFNFIIGLTVGVVASIILFLISASQKLIRLEESWDQSISTQIRSKHAETVLQKNANEILILNLQGPLFFSVIDILVNRLEKTHKKNENYIIINFFAVSAVDLTAEKILIESLSDIINSNKSIICVDIPEDMKSFRKSVSQIQGVLIYESFQEALQYCETHLLKKEANFSEESTKFTFSEILKQYGIESENVDNLENIMSKKSLKKEEVLINESDRIKSLFFVLSGKLEVYTINKSSRQKQFLANILPGTLLGESSFLADNLTASATVSGLQDSELLELKISDFKRLEKESYQESMVIMKLIGLVLRQRLIVNSRALKVH